MSLSQISTMGLYRNNTQKRGVHVRSIRSVMIQQVHEIANNCQDITDLYLHGTYVYLVKIVGIIKSKSTETRITKYIISDSNDSTSRISAVIFLETNSANSTYHNFEINDKVSLIGKIFEENNEIKIIIHHMTLNEDGISGKQWQSEMELHRHEMIFDKLINEIKQNEPQIYNLYLNEMIRNQNDYDTEYREKRAIQKERRNSNQSIAAQSHHNNNNKNNDCPDPPGFNLREKRNIQNRNNFSYNKDNNNCSGNALRRISRQRSNTFAPNEDTNYNYNTPKPRKVPQSKRKRRESAPFNRFNNNNNNDNNHKNGDGNLNEERRRINIIFGVIDTLFSLKAADVLLRDIEKGVRFVASHSEIKSYLQHLEDEGRIFSTSDDNHWRPTT